MSVEYSLRDDVDYDSGPFIKKIYFNNPKDLNFGEKERLLECIVDCDTDFCCFAPFHRFQDFYVNPVQGRVFVLEVDGGKGLVCVVEEDCDEDFDVPVNIGEDDDPRMIKVEVVGIIDEEGFEVIDDCDVCSVYLNKHVSISQSGNIVVDLDFTELSESTGYCIENKVLIVDDVVLARFIDDINIGLDFI